MADPATLLIDLRNEVRRLDELHGSPILVCRTEREGDTATGQSHEFLTAVVFAIPQDVPRAYVQVGQRQESNSPIKSRQEIALPRGWKKSDDLLRMIVSAGPKNSGRHSFDLIVVACDCEETEFVPIQTIVYDVGTVEELELLPSRKRESRGRSFVERSESLSIVHNWVALFQRAGELLLQVALDRFSVEEAGPFVPALAETEAINRWVRFLFTSLSVHRRHLVEWTEDKNGRWGVLPSLARSSIVEIDYLLNALSRPMEEEGPDDALDPLTEKQQEAFDLIVQKGPLLGKEVCNKLGIPSESVFTKHYVPALKRHGIRNKRGLGYYHPSTLADDSA